MCVHTITAVRYRIVNIRLAVEIGFFDGLSVTGLNSTRHSTLVVGITRLSSLVISIIGLGPAVNEFLFAYIE